MWPFPKKNPSPSSYRRDIEFIAPATEIDKFAALVLRSGLISLSKLQDVCANFDTVRTDEDAVNDFRNHLVAHNLLTTWQCEKLRHGKFKGFFLDGYCILEQIGKDMTSSTYLVREVETGKRMAMAVTPINIRRQKDGRPFYTVSEYSAEQGPHDA